MSRASSNPGDEDDANRTATTTAFEVRVAKESFKFSAAHFVAYRGFRERLHGHNYQVSVRLLGSRTLGPDGYVIDFGDVKRVTKTVCRKLNERFLCPTLSDVIDVAVEDTGGKETFDDDSDDDAAVNARFSVKLTCEDGAVFVFPRTDCAMLPIVHATAEELAVHIWGEILKGLDVGFLMGRGIRSMEVTVAEAPGQEASFQRDVPRDVGGCGEGTGDDDCGGGSIVDVESYIRGGNMVPTPCPSAPGAVVSNDGGGWRSSRRGGDMVPMPCPSSGDRGDGHCVGCRGDCSK